MRKITFHPGKWESEGLKYAYNRRFLETPVFCQEADCIVNSRKADDPDDYDYMGLLAPELLSPGAGISVRCSFEDLGAPMVLLSMKDEEDAEGRIWTLEYYEFVIWKNGLNVWRHFMRDGRPEYYLVMGAAFSLSQNQAHLLTVETQEGRFTADVDGHRFDLYAPDLGSAFRLGYTACEGFCRLYGLSLRDPAASENA